MNQETAMKRLHRLRTLGVAAVLALTATVAFAQQAAPAAPQSQANAIPVMPYKLVEGYFHYPAYYDLARMVGVAIGPKGQIVSLNRGPHPVIEFNADGSFLRSWGEGASLFEGAHVVRFDPQGNLWLVAAADNVIFRFDSEGRTVGILGTNEERWTYLTHVFEGRARAKTAFYQQTDIGWAKDGRSFIADGYGNSRIVVFSKDGTYLSEWGERGSAPGQFNTPHSLVVDNNDIIYVADRANNRIQTFDTSGKLLQVWPMPGPVWSICLTNGPNQVLFAGSIGRIYKLDIATGKILGQFGRTGRFPGTLDSIHQLACPDEKTLYVVNEFASRLDKWVLP
jgi:DNA-binding beta-propeller fold protein YncE